MSDNPDIMILFACCNGKICRSPFFTCSAIILYFGSVKHCDMAYES